MRRVLILLWLNAAFLTLCDVALASNEAVSHERIREVSADPVWLKLVHYERTLIHGHQSSILSGEFFLAPDGRDNPASELSATLTALKAMHGTKDDNVLCSHPARALFLQRKLGLAIADPFKKCAEFTEFASHGGINGISLLFIAGYLKNPGSAFGHLLLRFHTEENVEEVQDILDESINYGVAEAEEDSMPLYVLKGLFGGYESRFSTLKFFHQNERYRESQLRNIWEYRLNLSQEDIRFFVAHIWELLPAENRYYFLRENCAYYVAKALELVIKKDLIPKGKVWVAPVDIIHRLMDDAGGDIPIVKSVRRLASRETLFLEGYAALTAKEQSFVDDVIAKVDVPTSSLEENVTLDDLRPALDVLLDYYGFQDDDEKIENRRREILAARFALPASPTQETKSPIAPHKGQRPSLLRLSGLYNKKLGAGIELRLRPAYFDFLSETKGTNPYSELSIADTQIIFRSSDVSLRRFEAVRVANLNPSIGGRPNEGTNAWRMRFGAEQRDLECESCLVGIFEAGIGKSQEIADGAVIYSLLSGQFEVGKAAESFVYAVPQAGVVWKSQRIALEMEGSVLRGLADSETTKLIGHAELRFGINSQWDIRAKIDFDRVSEKSLSISYYW